MVLCEQLRRQMEELEVPSEYMLAISRIYENVIVVCIWVIDFHIFRVALLVLSKDAHSHGLYLTYALMNWKK